ncbi:hypothetical protein Y032_0001g114 [Ancylostoma ceylanicum]|uniref:Uncharacterized protein n=1 Tax=Ancylostoma ceylanicum TaxID=53326 RepID=A0A016W495_9BILA|nr:hypothetical protein Y032_0001g114 [Ancylostoma ceylanicum]
MRSTPDTLNKIFQGVSQVHGESGSAFSQNLPIAISTAELSALIQELRYVTSATVGKECGMLLALRLEKKAITGFVEYMVTT